MKNIVLSTIATVLLLVSCNPKNKEEVSSASEPKETASQVYACSMHPEITGKKGGKCSKCGMELTEPSKPTTTSKTSEESLSVQANKETMQSGFSINMLVADYISLKNAFVKDDTKEASTLGKKMYTTFNKMDTKSLESKLKKAYLDIADDAKEHAEHIGANAGNIAHQREHFVMLSKDINDLLKIFKTDQKLYQDYCPMADEGKGAIWISEIKEIKNPYYGSGMLTCGSMKKAL
jgi:hypothetical protein